MNAQALQTYLHDHIPLSSAMQVRVIAAADTGVELAAPLAPNINHRDTVFGGSASALAILAAWALIYVRLNAEGISSRVVIQRNSMNYLQPIDGDFTASSAIADDATWRRFVETLRRRQRARISLATKLRCGGQSVGLFEGDFVAIGFTPAS
jgi:thioesterase domain-containing protein